MGDRVAVLKDGYLQQVDTPQNLYDQPDNVFVAAFIGSPSMNLYEATLDARRRRRSVQLGEQTPRARRPSVLAAPPGAEGLRRRAGDRRHPPGGLRGRRGRPGTPADRRLKATVRLVEALGSELMVHFSTRRAAGRLRVTPTPRRQLGDGVANAVARFNPRSRARVDEDIEITVATENLHFFDPQTHLAIWS